MVFVLVEYRGRVVGEYFADLIVEDKVIVELKAVSNLNPSHEAQLLNYLKATP
ncbi:MAG: GxxExxY protein, partial [Chloroflexi bacterium]|nr:GxxExxY protein [Chloroflexota bacterium]